MVDAPPDSSARTFGWVALASVVGALGFGIAGSLGIGTGALTTSHLVLPLLGGLAGSAVLAITFAFVRARGEVLRGRRAESPSYPGGRVEVLTSVAVAASLSGLGLLVILGGYLAFDGLVPVLVWAAVASLLSLVAIEHLGSRPGKVGVVDAHLPRMRFAGGQFADQLLAITAAMALAYLNPLVYSLYQASVMFPLFLAAWVAVACFVGLAVAGGIRLADPVERLTAAMGVASVIGLLGLWFFASTLFGGNLGFWVGPAIGLFSAISLVAIGQSENARLGPNVRALALYSVVVGGLILAYAAVGWNESWRSPAVNFDLGVYGVGLWAVALGSMWPLIVAASAYERSSSGEVAQSTQTEGAPSSQWRPSPHRGIVSGQIAFSSGTAVATGWLVVWAFLWLSAASYQTSFDSLIATINLGAPLFVVGLAAGGALAVTGVGSTWFAGEAPNVASPRSARPGVLVRFIVAVGAVLAAGWLGGYMAVAGLLIGTLVAVMPFLLWIAPQRSSSYGSMTAPTGGTAGSEISAASTLVVRATGATALLFAAAFVARSLVGIP